MFKRRFFLRFVLVLALIVSVILRTIVSAEQSGSSPELGAVSRIKTVYDSLTSLGYGSTVAGSWGDWGAMWNRIYSASQRPFNDAIAKGLHNGNGTGAGDCINTSGPNCYPQAVGGVDDYNNRGSIPSDTYQSTWVTCNADNNYCATGRSVAEKQDANTGLVWSPVIINAGNWFEANNCKYPNGLAGDDGVCDNGNEVACQCVKHTGDAGDAKTGCEGYDDGNWRLATQKEEMQAYIDGAYGNLSQPNGNNNCDWSSTTRSSWTNGAWSFCMGYGGTSSYSKTATYASSRCVR